MVRVYLHFKNEGQEMACEVTNIGFDEVLNTIKILSGTLKFKEVTLRRVDG